MLLTAASLRPGRRLPSPLGGTSEPCTSHAVCPQGPVTLRVNTKERAASGQPERAQRRAQHTRHCCLPCKSRMILCSWLSALQAAMLSGRGPPPLAVQLLPGLVSRGQTPWRHLRGQGRAGRAVPR